MHLNIEIGDYVTRKSHNHDLVFKVINIIDDTVYLKGAYIRLVADSKMSDLKKVEQSNDDFSFDETPLNDRDSYFYLPGKILHIDGDNEYLDKCLKLYKKMGVYAIGKKINEDAIASQLTKLLAEFKPDIVIITGHDAYYEKKEAKTILKIIRIVKILSKP